MITRVIQISIVCCVLALGVAIYYMGAASKERTLPYLGEATVWDVASRTQETAYAAIPDFQFTNQYGEIVTTSDFEDKIYVADFFFTSCPTICPKMGDNKVYLQNAFVTNDEVLLLSHSIDSRTDSIPVLKAYAERYGALKDKWHLVRGDGDIVHEIAKEYYVTAQEDDLQKGTFIHDGSFILIDRKKNIRGIYDGTDRTSTRSLIKDIKILLNE